MFIEEEADGNPWFFDVKNLFQKQEYPPHITKNDKKTL
jgi:hypothetical protein